MESSHSVAAGPRAREKIVGQSEAASALIPPVDLKILLQRSDVRGLVRFAGHLAAIVGSLVLYAFALNEMHFAWAVVLGVAYGFTLVTMFAAMHECVHFTAFETPWLNRTVGWFAGLLSFYNSTFYRHYHTWHHRFTQIAGKDPELEDAKPTSLAVYLREMSGVTWWAGKLKTHLSLALGRTQGFPFLNEHTAPSAIRSVRLQLMVYALAIAISGVAGEPWLALYWLLPVALGQPLLRLILLAEHNGCTEDENPLSNTRTTHTNPMVRFLMWEMPFHAEHHRYPAIPFHALRSAHVLMGPRLSHVAEHGYRGFHVKVVRDLLRPSPRRSAA